MSRLMLAALTLAAGMAATACAKTPAAPVTSAPAVATPSPGYALRGTDILAVLPDGSSLTIAYEASATCDKSAVATVHETDKKITVEVQVWTYQGWCSLVGQLWRVTVHLKSPAGRRPIVDATGRKVARSLPPVPTLRLSEIPILPSGTRARP